MVDRNYLAELERQVEADYQSAINEINNYLSSFPAETLRLQQLQKELTGTIEQFRATKDILIRYNAAVSAFSPETSGSTEELGEQVNKNIQFLYVRIADVVYSMLPLRTRVFQSVLKFISVVIAGVVIGALGAAIGFFAPVVILPFISSTVGMYLGGGVFGILGLAAGWNGINVLLSKYNLWQAEKKLTTESNLLIKPAENYKQKCRLFAVNMNKTRKEYNSLACQNHEVLKTKMR